MNRSWRMRMAAAAVVLCAAHEARAGVIGLGDFSGGETVITFSGEMTLAMNVASFTRQGVTFTEMGGGIGPGGFNFTDQSSEFDNIAGSSQGFAVRDDKTDSFIQLEFPVSVLRAGLLLSVNLQISTWTVRALDATMMELGSTTVTQPAIGDAVFVGFEYAEGIRFLQIDEDAAMDQFVRTFIDDVRFEVPEPASAALLGFGAAGVLMRRRSSRASAGLC